MTVRKLFLITMLALVVLAAITGTTYIMYTSAVEQREGALDYRYQAFLLSEEMETDSSDLTNSVRLYAVTGEKKWRDNYFYVLDKAAGKVARKDGTTQAFAEKVKAMKLTAEEEGYLLQSKAESNGLVVVEVEVMDAVDAHAKRYGYGAAYLANKTPELDAQVLRLFDDVYFGFLRKIATEIEQFNDTLFTRVESQVAETGAKASIMEMIFFICLLTLVMATIAMIFYISRFLESRLGSEPAQLEDIARRIAAGDLSIAFTNSGQEKGVYSAMKQMRNQLSTVIEMDIQGLVDAAQRGDLSQRINLDGKEGCFGKLSEGINNLVKINDQVVKDTVRVFGAMARGNLGQTIESEYQGAFNDLKQDANLTIMKLTQVIEGDIQTLVNEAKSGNLSQRINVKDKEGFFKTLSTGINDLVEVNDRVIKDTVRVFGAMARGDLSQSIESEYQGSFNNLKQDANLTILKLTQVIEGDIQNLVNEAKSGNLSQRINVQDKEGFFKTLSTGINDLVDVSENVISDISRVMGALAKGNLSERVNADYQGVFARLKDDLNNTVIKLTDVTSKITESGNQVRTGSKEIAAGNLDLSQRTEEQASSLEETSASMEQLAQVVVKNAENAKKANELAQSAQQIAGQGGQVVSDAIKAMGEITSASKKIADIISVIDEIAFQTNLLALNAAVEAARAGEQGRGFAVVASEVRSLAQRSATAAKEIKDLIKSSAAQVENGTQLVNNSGETLSEIVSSVQNVCSMMNDISISTSEQSEGIAQVNTAVSQMDEMTQQNAALVEEAAAASQAMSDQAGHMLNLISFFSGHLENSVEPKLAQHSAIRKDKEKPTSYKAPTVSSEEGDEWEDF